MRRESDSSNIPYREFNIMVTLMRSHHKAHGSKLRAIVAFGDLVSSGESYDIHLLEVVEGWTGPRDLQFSSSSEIPLRGQLRIYFLTPEECENPEGITNTGLLDWVRSILEQAYDGYAIIFEAPFGYAQQALSAHREVPQLVEIPSTNSEWANPLHLPTGSQQPEQ